MSNAKSYDPRMESMPVLISYPRSGSNWLNAVMELYFNRPRLRRGPTTFLKDRDSRRDFMWFHDHDINSDLKLSHNNILYLYRNPCDVIFSLLMAEHPETIHSPTPLIEEQIKLIRKHYDKYLGNHPFDLKHYAITYEGCKEDLQSEFDVILRFFGLNTQVDTERLQKCVDRITKSDLISKATDKRYFNKSMMSSDYERQREAFRSQYGERIKEGVGIHAVA